MLPATDQHVVARCTRLCETLYKPAYGCHDGHACSTLPKDGDFDDRTVRLGRARDRTRDFRRDDEPGVELGDCFASCSALCPICDGDRSMETGRALSKIKGLSWENCGASPPSATGVACSATRSLVSASSTVPMLAVSPSVLGSLSPLSIEGKGAHALGRERRSVAAAKATASSTCAAKTPVTIHAGAHSTEQRPCPPPRMPSRANGAQVL